MNQLKQPKESWVWVGFCIFWGWMLGVLLLAFVLFLLNMMVQDADAEAMKLGLWQ